ncbi:ATP-binding cassette sub-family A member 2 [Armigeres subalbatus]|uniref:ATP-binding cassette sub-family A member 2 n=1 Tax=Armigeres subalbatus TaxID=124917 RepID=UPI002ED52318
MTNNSLIIKTFLLKAWKEKKRHPFRNVLNTLFPVVVIGLYVLSRLGYQRSAASAKESFVITVRDGIVDSFPSGSYSKLFYAPENEFTKELIEFVRIKLFITIDRVHSFPTVAEMEQILLFNQNYFAIAFDRNSSRNYLSYTIRSKNNNFRTDEIYSRDLYRSYLKDGNEYQESGFLALQYGVEKSFVQMSTGLAEAALPEYSYQHIPLTGPRPQESSEIFVVSMMLAICVSVACTYLLLVPLVDEKASGMKEYLKIATPYSYWNEVAIYLINFVQLIVIVIFCLTITILADVWEGTAAQMVFVCVLLVLFVICSISFTFFISTLLESVTISTIVAPICYFVPVVFASVHKPLETLLMIFPMTGFKIGVSILHDYQNSWHSFKTLDAFKTGYPGNQNSSLGFVLFMQVVGIALWTFLWFYISNVRPGQYGTPKPWTFIFSKKYYQKSNNRITQVQHSERNHADGRESARVVEEIDNSLEKVVRISNLHKIFKTSSGTRVAVQKLSLNIYKNKITALLGHNGAGKTTTMNIITGMIPRTSGHIEVDGEDNASNYRQQIGFCPQHNVALSFMSCREHLVFFGSLRGMNVKDAEREADDILEKVNLADKRDEILKNLSGGMKRRLCLANAIIGRTKLLILDEPTSGLDPESRRDIWDILLRLKKDHTILITTHFMEEADILGDRIAIMENGELIAFGTSIFLKHYFGKGYTLKLLKGAFFNRDKVMAKIIDHIDKATERPAVQSIFAVTLPYENMQQYSELLKELEDSKSDYGIETISMTNTTLEEVFLKSSSENKAIQNERSLDLVDSPERSQHSVSISQQPTKPISPQPISQFKAIAYKKYLHIHRNWHIYLTMSTLPIVATILSFILSGGYSLKHYSAVNLHHSSVQQAFAVIILNGNDRPVVLETIKNETYFRDLDLVLLEEQNIDDYLLQESQRNIMRYRHNLVAAVEFNVSQGSLKILHNNNLLHSSGIANNIGSNLLLHYYGYPRVEVLVKNSPSTRRMQLDSITPYVFTEAISLVFMLYILQYLQLPYLEAATGFKKLQNINRYVYWGGTFLVDYALHIVICLVVFGAAQSLDRERLFSTSEHGQILTVLLLYGIAALPMIYIVSQCVDKMDTAVTFMSYLMIVGVCGVFLLSDGYDRIRENSGVIFLLHLVPEFGLKHSLRVVYENQKLTKMHALLMENTIDNPTATAATPRLGLYNVYCMMPLLMISFMCVLNEVVENMYRRSRIIDSKIRVSKELRNRILCMQRKRRKALAVDQPDSNYEIMDADIDDDVDAESKLVSEMVSKDPPEFASHTIAVHGLKKWYLNLPAVKGVSFAVKRGECFGLLGMNGAGKTSTFQMITHNTPITEGSIYLNKHDIKESSESEYRSQYGYCPQGDALLDFMTPHELIRYCAIVKNLENIDELTNYWLTDLDILSYAHSRINECSGGTKRKVNTILAMLGNPSIVFLDEPTTGVDPKSRHFVWSRIKALQRADQTIILTSHSMDECEELCNRLSIMVDGRLRCIGFIQRLKEKYGKGFNLLLKLKNHEIQQSCELIDEVKRRFECELKEEHDGMLKFLVPEKVALSQLFGEMHTLKQKSNGLIVNFLINETSLEDIFLNFRPAKIVSNEMAV